MMRLIDLGERDIVRRLIAPRVSGLGDDCAVALVGLDGFVATTDPVPVPAAQVIAGDPDPYWAGWLLVTINASDIAASGARPIGFMAALENPPETEEADFVRLLDGIRDSCEQHGLPYIGGNIKEAGRFAAIGSAFGVCQGRPAITRLGAQVGDVVALVGRRPRFWSDALSAKSGVAIQKDSPLFKPIAAIPVMERLAIQGLVAAAIDNSDGLLPSAKQLAERSRVAIEINVGMLRSICSASTAVDDPARLALGWGDWNILSAVRADCVDDCRDIAERLGYYFDPIGHCISGTGVWLRGESTVMEAPRLESERFSKDSWFIEGIDGYIKRLLDLRLPD